MTQKQVVVLSGLAGAGKTTAARALEDLGFFVIDNLPPQLIETLMRMTDSAGGELEKMAFVVDAREAAFLAGFAPTWERLQAAGHDTLLVFLDCTDEVLIRRFTETRRKHPLDDGQGIVAAIAKERKLLEDISHRADTILDTRNMSVHDLKRIVVEKFAQAGRQKQLVTVMSFGYKHGLPHEVDLLFDVRFLPNPFFVDALRPMSGLDAPVRDYVMAQADARTFLDKVDDLVEFLLPRFEAEGKAYVTVGVGCTGGRHRSPCLTVALAERLQQRGHVVRVAHRDLQKGAAPAS